MYETMSLKISVFSASSMSAVETRSANGCVVVVSKGRRRSPNLATGVAPLPVLSCNRVGHEASPLGASGIQFWGNSHVLGPQGEFIAEAAGEAEILSAEIDLQRSEHVRRIWPFLRDRRIDAYGDLLKRYID